MNIAILGVGTVGEAVAKILLQNKKLIAARCGEEIVPVIGVVRNLSKKRDVAIPLTDDIDSVIKREDIDVFVELMGGVGEPFRVVSKILERRFTARLLKISRSYPLRAALSLARSALLKILARFA